MDLNELELICPSLDMKDEILKYKEEHFAHGDMQVHGTGGLAYYDEFDEWLEHIETIRKGIPDTGIKTSTLFSRRVSDGKLTGCIKIHHGLNDELKNGGHIAYGIRPSERGKGYGVKQLKLILDHAKQNGIEQLIIACDKDNIASAKTAMKCGGILIKEFEEGGVMKQHYLIELKGI
ncbi:MAG: GNAT family N-acetyltransferase [Lachnospiraceae bacterium]|nr:GNAT family N-acetyltransferase [Lachnospiraceae bacterium]